MGTELLILIVVIIFFFGFAFFISLIDIFVKYSENWKRKKQFREIILIPSGQILMINLYDFDLLKDKKIIYNYKLLDWTIDDDCWIVNELKKTKPNC